MYNVRENYKNRSPEGSRDYYPPERSAGLIAIRQVIIVMS
jgi:hypothetical protein